MEIMAKKMLIDATHAEETRVVVVEGNKVEEFDFESENRRQLAGNIYLAKVTRIEPSLQAAFIDYGGNRHGFLAFSEIHPDYYQIPVADREALMEEERAFSEALRRKDDEEESDELLKNEFDGYREQKKPHPYMKDIDKNLIPFQHEDLNKWRANFTGVQFHHEETDLLLTGAVDDVWIDLDTDELVVVDYKSTSSKDEVNLDKDWQISYKRQMEFYQWLLRQNGFKVSNDGYFVYCNGIKDKDSFDEVLEFRVKILHYQGDDSWVEPTLLDIYKALQSNSIPKKNDECDTCSYVETRFEISTNKK